MVVGCLERVFTVELDLERFRSMDASSAGFGGLRAAREPLARCRTSVEPGMPHRLPGRCANPEMNSPMADPDARDDGSLPHREGEPEIAE